MHIINAFLLCMHYNLCLDLIYALHMHIRIEDLFLAYMLCKCQHQHALGTTHRSRTHKDNHTRTKTITQAYTASRAGARRYLLRAAASALPPPFEPPGDDLTVEQ